MTRLRAAVCGLLLLLAAAPVSAQMLGLPQRITTQDSGTACSVVFTCATFQVGTASSASFQISGTWTGTITFEGSADGSTFVSLVVQNIATSAQVTSTTANAAWNVPNGGLTTIRARATAGMTGTAVVTAVRGYAGGRLPPTASSLIWAGTSGGVLYFDSATSVASSALLAANQLVLGGGAGTAPSTLGSLGTTAQFLRGNAAGAPSFTATLLGAYTAERAGIATTSTDGDVMSNATAATAIATVQMSPRTRWVGTAWDTAASQTVAFFGETLPATAATPTGTWKLGYSLNGAAASYPFTLSSTGVGTFLSSVGSGGNVTATGDLRAGAAGSIYWNTRASLTSTADGVINLTNNAGTGFTALDIMGAIVYSNGTPVITSGISTTTPTIGGNDSVFVVTVKATPGVTGLITFGQAFSFVPSVTCVNTITANVVQAVPTTTNVVLNGVWLANDIIRCTAFGPTR